MIVYELFGADHEDDLHFAQESDLCILKEFLKMKPLKEGWTPVKVEKIRNNNARDYVPNDFPKIASMPVFSKRAISELAAYLERSGEVLPLIFNNRMDEYFAFNVLNVVDALDEENSKISRFASSGRIKNIETYEFFQPKLQGLVLFKIPQVPPRIFVTDSFVQKVETAGLSGFYFREIWRHNE
jgi:hypothetical protein